jgi:hypothetical protein
LTEYGLKLSLGLLFGTSNILSLGWGSSRTYLSKRKNEKKCRLPWVYTQKIERKNKKKKKKIKSQKHKKNLVSSKKLFMFMS